MAPLTKLLSDVKVGGTPRRNPLDPFSSHIGIEIVVISFKKAKVMDSCFRQKYRSKHRKRKYSMATGNRAGNDNRDGGKMYLLRVVL